MAGSRLAPWREHISILTADARQEVNAGASVSAVLARLEAVAARGRYGQNYGMHWADMVLILAKVRANLERSPPSPRRSRLLQGRLP